MNTAIHRPAPNNQRFKLRVIYLPFLIIGLSFIIVYTLLNWALFIRTGSTAVPEDILHLWLPMLLPWIPVLIWLRPRLALLHLKTSSGDLPTLFLLVAIAAMAVPAIIAQKYLATATGELTELQTVRKASRWNTTKFYTIQNYFADKGHAAVAYSAQVSGKRSEHLDLELSFSVPVYDNQDVLKLEDLSPFFKAQYKPTVFVNGEVVDSAQVPSIAMDSVTSIYMLGLRASRSVYGRDAWNGAIFVEKIPSNYEEFRAPSELHKFTPKVWVGVNYKKRIDNDLSDEEKYREYNLFVNESVRHFKAREIGGFAYLDRLGNTPERKGYVTAIKESNYYDDANPLVLVPVYGPFKERNGNKLQWIFGSFGIGAGVWLLMILAAPVRSRNLKAVRRRQAAAGGGLKELQELVVPKEGYFVTPIIMHLNIAVFGLMVCAGLGFMTFSAVDALRWGGNFRPYTTAGEWWRLVTSMFLHGGVVHLVANMIGLVFVSVFLEPLLGKGRFVLAYLLTGLVGSLASISWYPATVSVGASGAIFGLYGVFLALLLTRMFPRELNKSFLISTSLFVGYNLLMGLQGGIDNAAHIGGLVSGLLVGFCFYPFLRKKEEVVEERFEFEQIERARKEESPTAPAVRV
jgi:rhomboid protease GluP